VPFFQEKLGHRISRLPLGHALGRFRRIRLFRHRSTPKTKSGEVSHGEAHPQIFRARAPLPADRGCGVVPGRLRAMAQTAPARLTPIPALPYDAPVFNPILREETMFINFVAGGAARRRRPVGVQHFDPIGKLIVLVLIGASILAWSINARQVLELRKVERADQNFAHAFERQENPLEIFVRGPAHPDRPDGQGLAGGGLRGGEARIRGPGPQAATAPSARSTFRMERLSALQIRRHPQGGRMPPWPTRFAAVGKRRCPCWVHLHDRADAGPVRHVCGAFSVFVRADGQARLGNLSEAAPGISSALLTTIVGLIVAMPSANGLQQAQREDPLPEQPAGELHREVRDPPAAIVPLTSRSRPWPAARR
jgi:hypothetical protein